MSSSRVSESKLLSEKLMSKINAYKNNKLSEKIFFYSEEVENRLRSISTQTCSIKTAANRLNQVLKWFKIQGPSYDEIYHQTKSDPNYVFLSKEQKSMLNEIVEEVCAMVPFHDFVVRGFIIRGIINWQNNTRKPIFSLSRMNPLEKLQTMSKILTYMSTHICNAIYSPNKGWKEQLKSEIFRKAIECYEEYATAQNLFLNNPILEDLDFNHFNMT